MQHEPDCRVDERSHRYELDPTATLRRPPATQRAGERDNAENLVDHTQPQAKLPPQYTTTLKVDAILEG